jgi:predicted GNAT family N-acyltransferase
MTETTKNTALSIQISTPAKAGRKKLQQFHDLVLWGEQVNANFLMKRINNCELLAFGWIESDLAGIAALKNPAAHHKAEVFGEAGKPEEAMQYAYELGYAVTSENYQHQGICKQLIKALLDAYAGAWCYATTKNDYMRTLLAALGFEKLGESYQNPEGETLDLYIFNK